MQRDLISKDSSPTVFVRGSSLYINGPDNLTRLEMKSILQIKRNEGPDKIDIVTRSDDTRSHCIWSLFVEPQDKAKVMRYIFDRLYEFDEKRDKNLTKISENLEKLANNISFSVGSPEFEGAKKDFEKNTKQ